MNILFVSCSPMNTNTGLHIFHIANTLVSLGHDCVVFVPSDKEKSNQNGTLYFKVYNYSDFSENISLFDNDSCPSIMHVWTPRECVRKFVEERVLPIIDVPYVVHMEDNEEYILRKSFGCEYNAISTKLIPSHLSHPIKYKDFISRACGMTALTESLLDFKPITLPGCVIWPGFDCIFDSSNAISYTKSFYNIPDKNDIVVYTGGVHESNKDEVLSLYLAIYILNRKGIPITLIRTGDNHVKLISDELSLLKINVIELGVVDRDVLPKLVSMATFLIQPGRLNDFNNYRFPSKLPDFLISGKPVILPNTNIGLEMRDKHNCLLLNDGSAIEMSSKIEWLIKNKNHAINIGENGKSFASKYLTWDNVSSKLIPFYSRNIKKGVLNMSIIDKYCNYSVDSLSYGTVRDFCDSMDNIAELATINNDLKDVQRPWVVKAILSNIPLGGKLLEIGGGDPHVANMLSNLGYDVTIVDPYDGSGSGPTAFDVFEKRYPRIKIIRDYFNPSTVGLIENSYDCIYSVSVLEHIPDIDLIDLFRAERIFGKKGVYKSIHAIDHVLMGRGAESHYSKLKLMVDESGLNVSDLDIMLHNLTNDVDTYFLSAEGHNMWRASLSYDEFPMRKCVSIHLCS